MRRVVLTMLIATVVTGSAAATGFDDFNAGVALSNRDDYAGAVQYLSRAIAAPDLPVHLKAPAYLARGLAYARQKDADRAQADFSAAIGLNPRRVSGYMYRADMEERRQNYNAAVSDYTAVIKLKPLLTDVYFSRGVDYEELGRFSDAASDFQFYAQIEDNQPTGFFHLGFSQWAQGQFAQATAAFQQSVDLDKTFSYGVLWREIAQTNGGANDSRLKRQARDLDTKSWPAPVVGLYLGKSSVDEVLAAAGKGNAKDLDVQKCEANFYVAEWELLQKNASAARPFLGTASQSCPHGFVELKAANIELSRLSVGSPQ